MSLQQYDVVYAGAILAGFTEGQVKSNFIERLKIPESKVDRLFSGKRVTLKKSLEKDRAEKWQSNLLKIGAESVLVPSIVKSHEGKNAGKETVKEAVTSQDSAKTGPSLVPENQSDYDEEMEQRIRVAKAMIASQQLEQQMSKNKEPNTTKRLVLFSLGLGFLIFVFYFYADSMT